LRSRSACCTARRRVARGRTAGAVDSAGAVFLQRRSTKGCSLRTTRARGRVARLGRETASTPNHWFNHVELVAAEKIGAETVTYVSNIYKYYTAYKLIVEQDAERRKAREELQKK
jgi:hypothetical protein